MVPLFFVKPCVGESLFHVYFRLLAVEESRFGSQSWITKIRVVCIWILTAAIRGHAKRKVYTRNAIRPFAVYFGKQLVEVLAAENAIAFVTFFFLYMTFIVSHVYCFLFSGYDSFSGILTMP